MVSFHISYLESPKQAYIVDQNLDVSKRGYNKLHSRVYLRMALDVNAVGANLDIGAFPFNSSLHSF